MGDYRIVKNDKINSLDGSKHEKIICINSELENFTLKENANINVKECIFVNCKNKNLTILKIKSFKKIIFINCKIRDLWIKNSYLPNLQFIGCDIFNSKFKNSTLPGVIFSRDTKEVPKNALEEIQKSLKNSKIEFSKQDSINESTINRTEFMFCELNDMRIDKTEIRDSKFKHCNIEHLKVMGNVVLKNIDLRGSKFLESDFGNGRFNNIKFRKGFFLIEWFDFILSSFITFAMFFLSMISGKKWSFRKIKIKEIMMRVRHFIKKILYISILRLLIDFLSSTDCKNTQYKEADLSEDYHFLWHIQDLDFIHNFKKKHPIFAFLTFWTSNYMRSFGALLSSSFIVVWLFSLLHSSNWTIFGKINPAPDYYLYLSFKIFTNFGMDPLDAQNWITKFLVISEVIIGYFALGILLSIILYPFSRRTSLPGSNKEKNNEKSESRIES